MSNSKILLPQQPGKTCLYRCSSHGPAAADVTRILEAGFKKLTNSTSESLLKRFLTKEVFQKLKPLKTKHGATLLDCIQSGFEQLDSKIGIYAADSECYDLFSDLLTPVIEEYFKQRKITVNPGTNWGDYTDFEDLDPHGKYIVSTRVSCSRNIRGYPFAAGMKEVHYEIIESMLCGVLRQLEGELRGSYHHLSRMQQSAQKRFIAEHLLFKENDRFLYAADACRFWPTGRGIYFNTHKNFLAWVNEEDHIKLTSMQHGGNMGEAIKRLIQGMTTLEKKGLKFAANDRYGFLTFSLSNLGNTVRAYVQVKLPKLAGDMPRLQELAAKHKIIIKEPPSTEEACSSTYSDDTFELRSTRRLGVSEYRTLMKMHVGIKAIIEAEKKAAKLEGN